MVHPADRLAFDRAMVTQPVWNRFNTGKDALGLAENMLLHAGPAFATPDLITAPIFNSACVAAVFEGIARDFDQAGAMITRGEIVLEPAQDMMWWSRSPRSFPRRCLCTPSMTPGRAGTGFSRR